LDKLLKVAIKAHGGGLNTWNQFERLRAMRAIYPLFRVLFPNQVIPADDLARAMVDAAVRETGKTGGLFSRTATSEPWSSKDSIFEIHADPVLNRVWGNGGNLVSSRS